jgi:ArsR family transcriptional regulator
MTARANATAPPDPFSTADVELAVLCKALGHPARVAILRHIVAEGGCICGDIVARVPLAQATVSQHLKVLKEAGILRGEIDGPRICYCPDPSVLDRLRAGLLRLDPGGSNGNACRS